VARPLFAPARRHFVQKPPQNFVHFYHLRFSHIYVILLLSQGERNERGTTKKLEKSLKNLLTNFPKGDTIKMFQRERKNEKENSSQTRKELPL
jgi:hypothetical protein